jgi:GR25 family glycosyltransferase involved in LPS biosynthesis
MIPRFYCINLSYAEARRKRMIDRFEFHGLEYEFIDAVKYTDDIINYLIEGYHDITPKSKSECACMQSHLKAINKFLESNEKYGIICEDDILLHNNFKERFEYHFNNFPKDSGILMLGYFIEYWIGFKWSGNDLELQNLCFINPDHTWGAFCYLINRDYALDVIRMYENKRWIQMRSLRFLTSEIITRFSRGHLCYPILVIEEACDSHIRGKDELKLHEKVFGPWGYKHFNSAEKEHVSPLKDFKI